MQETAVAVGAVGIGTREGPRVVSYRAWLANVLVTDATAALLGTALAVLFRLGTFSTGFSVAHVTVPYALSGLLVLPAWLAILLFTGAYDHRFLAAGSEYFQRVVNSGAWLLGAAAVASFWLGADLSRWVLALTALLTTALALLFRLGIRSYFRGRLRAGEALHRTLIVGDPRSIERLDKHFGSAPHAGFHVAGTFSVNPAEEVSPEELSHRIFESVLQAEVDTIALAGSHSLAPEAVRALSWRLEGSGVQFVVAPALVDFAGPRISVRPAAGLPLLHIDDPATEGGRRLGKALLDRAGALVLFVLGAPFLALIALAVFLQDFRTPIFWQTRVGARGRQFRMAKFRTMRPDAEQILVRLYASNQSDGPLFKMRRDPRVTPVGRLLRRFSLDELPQLWNVLTGEMSLVGPRPALPREVETYEQMVRRRLLVKPGLTGLWQVSGRADLRWEDSVRLDLYYVENWTPLLDFTILLKTALAVVRGQGAY